MDWMVTKEEDGREEDQEVKRRIKAMDYKNLKTKSEFLNSFYYLTII